MATAVSFGPSGLSGDWLDGARPSQTQSMQGNRMSDSCLRRLVFADKCDENEGE